MAPTKPDLTPSYRDLPGLTNRANSALLTIEHIAACDWIPSPVRLALIARVMDTEPVLVCPSVAAIKTRNEADQWADRIGFPSLRADRGRGAVPTQKSPR